MSQSLIRTLYETRADAFAASRNLRIAHDNEDFEPTVDEVYLRIYVLPGSTASNDLAGEHRNYVGVVQINVDAPKGGGPKQAGDIADLIVAQFPLNQLLSSGAFTVQQVTPASIGPGIPDSTRYSVPVSFSYSAHTTP